MQPHIIEHNNIHTSDKMIKTFSNSNSPAFLMDNLLKEEQCNTILKEKTSLTVGITASYSIVQQHNNHESNSNNRNCNCGSEDCNNSYINSSEESISPNEDDTTSVNKMDFINNDVCTCNCDKNNDNNDINNGEDTLSKPILKFSVSAILGDKPTPCTGKYIYFYFMLNFFFSIYF